LTLACVQDLACPTAGRMFPIATWSVTKETSFFRPRCGGPTRPHRSAAGSPDARRRPGSRGLPGRPREGHTELRLPSVRLRLRIILVHAGGDALRRGPPPDRHVRLRPQSLRRRHDPPPGGTPPTRARSGAERFGLPPTRCSSRRGHPLAPGRHEARGRGQARRAAASSRTPPSSSATEERRPGRAAAGFPTSAIGPSCRTRPTTSSTRRPRRGTPELKSQRIICPSS
jgi:hypothetical protein